MWNCSDYSRIFQILYGLPVGLNKLDDLSALQAEMEKYGGTVRILLDDLAQVKFLGEYEKMQEHPKTWSAFIKMDDGHKYVSLSIIAMYCSQISTVTGELECLSSLNLSKPS
jgi:hypothetical protein